MSITSKNLLSEMNASTQVLCGSQEEASYINAHGIQKKVGSQQLVSLSRQYDIYTMTVASNWTLGLTWSGLNLSSNEEFSFEIWVKLNTGGSLTLPGTWECVGNELDVSAGHTAYLACRVDSTGHVMYNQYYKA